MSLRAAGNHSSTRSRPPYIVYIHGLSVARPTSASTLVSVLLEHAAYILHQSFELPHLSLTKLLDAFVLYARYDLICYPPHLPSSFGEANDLGPPIGRVRHALYVTRCLKSGGTLARRAALLQPQPSRKETNSCATSSGLSSHRKCPDGSALPRTSRAYSRQTSNTS